MIKKILFTILVLSSFLGYSQKISQYLRTFTLNDSSLMDVSFYNGPGSYSTRAVSWYTMRTSVISSDTSHLLTTGDNGYGNYNLYGSFLNYKSGMSLINTGLIAGSIFTDGVSTFSAGVSKGADTVAGIQYLNGGLYTSIVVERLKARIRFQRSLTEENLILLRRDSLVFRMNNISGGFMDTTGRMTYYKGLNLFGLNTVGASTDSILSRNPTTGKIELVPQFVLVDTGYVHTTGDTIWGDLYIKNSNLYIDGTNKRLSFTTTNSLIGYRAGNSLTTGTYNTYLGYDAGLNNTNQIDNVAVGSYAGRSNIGTRTTYVGSQAGYWSTGSSNTGMGYAALGGASGIQNSAFGQWALAINSTGYSNTAIGFDCMARTLVGYQNTAAGLDAMYFCNSNNNVGLGAQAGYHIRGNSNENVFIGAMAGRGDGGLYGDTNYNILRNIIIGYSSGYNIEENNNDNIFLGAYSGYNDTTGIVNMFLGNYSGYTNVVGNYNIFMGHNSGYTNTANNNMFLGYQSGYSNTSGTPNTFIGYQAGYFNTTQIGNSYLGFQTGQNNTTNYNTCIGEKAGIKVATGNGQNTFVGYNSSSNATMGQQNVAVGMYSGSVAGNYMGNNNVLLGTLSGYNGVGNNNIGIGSSTLYANDSMGNNIAIGTEAGYNCNGNGNIFLGYQAGYNETGSNKYYLDNSNTADPLIYGDFALNHVKLNSDLEVAGDTVTLFSEDITGLNYQDSLTGSIANPITRLNQVHTDSLNTSIIYDNGDGVVTINDALNYGADAEVSDTYIITITGISSYQVGLRIVFMANTDNTGACTININSLGAKSLKAFHDQDPPDSYIESGSMVDIIYDGTNFQILSPDNNP